MKHLALFLLVVLAAGCSLNDLEVQTDAPTDRIDSERNEGVRERIDINRSELRERRIARIDRNQRFTREVPRIRALVKERGRAAIDLGERAGFEIGYSEIADKELDVYERGDKIVFRERTRLRDRFTTASRNEPYEVNVYRKEAYGTEALEYEIILNEHPGTSTFNYELNASNLVLYEQKPLYVEAGLEFPTEDCNATHCNGKIRPLHIVNSYAAYYKDARPGLNETGKAFHLYRPWFNDSNGNFAWGEISMVGNSLTITAPDGYMESASYPVIIDPTFGYTTAGGTYDNLCCGDKTRGSEVQLDIGGYNVTSMSVLLRGAGVDDGIVDYKMGLYNSTSYLQDTSAGYFNESGGTTVWRTQTMSAAEELEVTSNGTLFHVAVLTNLIGGNPGTMEDSASAGTSWDDGATWSTFSSSIGTKDQAIIYSLYATYTEFNLSDIEPVLTTPTFNDSNVFPDEDVRASTTYSDPDGDSGNVTAYWYVNGAQVHTETQTSISSGATVNFDLSSGNYSENDNVVFNATPSNNLTGSTVENSFTVGSGTLAVSVVTPSNNTEWTQNSTNSFTINVTCTSFSCGNVSAYLDPISELYSDNFEDGADWLEQGECASYWNYASSTPSSNTGPQSGDSSDSGSNFVYMENSAGNCDGGLASDEGFLVFDQAIDWDSQSEENITFKTNLYGTDIGTLELQENSTGSWLSMGYSQSGNDGNSGTVWSQQSQDASDLTGTGYVRFRYAVSSSFEGDVAIDDFNITGESGASKGFLVSTVINDTPFYTTNNNPFTVSDDSCLDMSAGDSCELTWNVVSTGDVGNYTFFAYVNSTYNETTVDSERINIILTNITDLIAPQWSDNSTNSTVAGESILFSAFWTDNTNLSGGDTQFYLYNGSNTTGTVLSGDVEAGTQNNTAIGAGGGGGDLTVDGTTVTLTEANNTQAWDTLEVINGGTLVIDPTDGNFVQINATSFFVDSTSTVDGTGYGYAGGALNSAGSGPGAGGTCSNDAGGGGGYGGAGSDAPDCLTQGGSSYGSSTTDAIQMGSGGGAGSGGGNGVGGDGGSALYVWSDDIDIDGTMQFEGDNAPAAGTRPGGGGSGGGLLLKGDTIDVSGTITLDGGNGGTQGSCNDCGGGGGGGRYKVFYGTSYSTTGSTITVNGGIAENTAYNGDAGSTHSASISYTPSVSGGTGNNIDSNLTAVQYENTISSISETLTEIEVTVGVTSFDDSGSTDNGSTAPDLYVSLYNGSEYIEIGQLNVTASGDYSITSSNTNILSAWSTANNSDVRIQAKYLDYINDSTKDSILYDSVNVTVSTTQEYVLVNTQNWNNTTLDNDTQGWSNFTAKINNTVGATIRWYLIGTDQISNSNTTDTFEFTTTGDVIVNSCSPTGSTSHVYECTDSCNVTSNIDFGSNDVTFNGSGITRIDNAVLSSTGTIRIQNSCTVRLINGGEINQ